MGIIMKTSHAVFCSTVAGLLIAVSGISYSQETTSPAQTQATQEKQEAQKKEAKKKPSFMTAVEASVSDLTEEQKAGMKTLLEEAHSKNKKINDSAGLTSKMLKKREEIMEGLSTDTPYAKRSQQASEQAGFNEAQISSLKDIAQTYRQFRYGSMQILSAEQRSKMPKWFQDDYSKSVTLAEKEAEAEKTEAAKTE